MGIIITNVVSLLLVVQMLLVNKCCTTIKVVKKSGLIFVKCKINLYCYSTVDSSDITTVISVIPRVREKLLS